MNRTTRKTQPTGNIMHRVSLALLPGALAMAWQYGVGVIWNLLWLVVLCALVEILCSSLRHGGCINHQLGASALAAGGPL